MAKEKLLVHRLTLAPASGTGKEDCDDGTYQQEEEERHMLDREQMARITDIAIMVREGNPLCSHVHGVEPRHGSKFWATREDGDSSREEDEGCDEATPMLMDEALAVGFTIDQIHQVEAELETPSTSTPKVQMKLKEGSFSKQIIDAWVRNRWNDGKPWIGPVPPPRKSPLRTLGDAIATTKVENHQKLLSLNAMKDHHRGSHLPESSSAQKWHMPSPIVTSARTLTSARTMPQLDHMVQIGALKSNKRGTSRMPEISATTK
jgi:hypothetical protein